jgi:NAD(P)-dependent dehydrogenase (short-subunit alcohol dehydrogenase family)
MFFARHSRAGGNDEQKMSIFFNNGEKPMTQKIALVTGATRGIGFETVRQLAQKNVHVLLAGRDRAKATEAALKLQSEGLPVEAIALDVNDAQSIAAAAKEVEKKHGRLDILVNNAGVLLDDTTKKPSEQTLDIWRKTFDTNLFAVVAVTQAFLPLLRKSEGGRIVNVSSILGSLALHSDPTSGIYDFKIPAYDASKSALNAWTVHLAHELRDTKIKVNAIHPGSVKTDMNSRGDLEVSDGAKSSVELALIDADGPSGSFSHLGKTLPW